jgi:exopolysaccharide biosynthesis polyprenyl glycosylphosphotransferase
MNSATKPLRFRIKNGERRAILMLGDLVAGAIALWLTLYLWAGRDDWLKGFSYRFLETRPPFWFFLLPLVWLIFMVELYEPKRANRKGDTVSGIFVAAMISTALYLALYIASPANSLPRYVIIFILTTTLLTLGWRMVYIAIFTAPSFRRRVLIVGAGKAGCTLLEVVNAANPPPFYIAGLIDDDPNKIGKILFGYKVMGDHACLLDVIQQNEVTDLILAISGQMDGGMYNTILAAEEKGVEVTTMPIVYEEILGRVPIMLLEADWIIRSFVDQAHASAFYELTKRLIDIVGGLVGLLGCAILSPFLGAGIVIDTGFPILFTQNRLGKSGQTYRIIKFRTMRKDSEKDGKPRVTQEGDERITRIGWLLRKTHLDELPQFINVVKGEMSLVGPRAERSELVEDLQQKIPFYRARLLVKPGITGWAQINFGYAATVEDTIIKLEYDLYYIKHRNLITDLVILLRTVGTVVGFKGQ